MVKIFIRSFLFLVFYQQVRSFVPPLRSSIRTSSYSRLTMQPGNENEGYGLLGSLTRQGPVPFFIRVVKPDTYNAAIEKYMRSEKVSRLEAQANMDAYFQDPNGWAGQKLRERNGGPKTDYVNVNQSSGSLTLTAVWAVGILGLFWRIFEVQVLNK